MNKDVFVQNVKKYCALKGVKPTVACDESGAGKNLIGQLVNRDTVPSVERVQLLAQYLGVTTSDLLGEQTKAARPRRRTGCWPGMTRSAHGIGKSWRNIWTCCYRLKIGHETPTVFRRKPPVFLDEALV